MTGFCGIPTEYLAALHCYSRKVTYLKVAEERVHKHIKKDEWCKDGIQNTHKNEASAKPMTHEHGRLYM